MLLKSSSVCHAPGIDGLEDLLDSGGVQLEACEAIAMSGPIDRGIAGREGDFEAPRKVLEGVKDSIMSGFVRAGEGGPTSCVR